MRLSFRRRPRQVVVYGKPGCHLCDDVLETLHMLARRYPMALSEVDIRSEPELFRRYDILIPVVVIEGGRELHAPISETMLIDALR